MTVADSVSYLRVYSHLCCLQCTAAGYKEYEPCLLDCLTVAFSVVYSTQLAQNLPVPYLHDYDVVAVGTLCACVPQVLALTVVLFAVLCSMQL